MSVKVAFFSRYGRKGASSRYRFIQFFDIYRRYGIEPVHLPFYSDNYLQRRYAGKMTFFHMVGAFLRRTFQILFSRKRYPLIVLEYELFPYIPRFVERIALKWIGSPYVVEYDDAVYSRYERKIFYPLRSKIPSLLREARLVIAGSDYLRDQLTYRGAENVAVVPTSVSSKKYQIPQKLNICCTLVWIGSSTTAEYIEQIGNALRRLLKGKVRLMVIGAGEWRFSEDDNVVYKDWSEDAEAQLLAECDIGIMPLPDTDWARGKCGLKIIQYMMAGLPVVASNVGANREIISPGIDGYLASGESEWYEFLKKLICDVDKRTKFGKCGRKKALDLYCVENNAEMILGLYAGVMLGDDLETRMFRQKLKSEELQK